MFATELVRPEEGGWGCWARHWLCSQVVRVVQVAVVVERILWEIGCLSGGGGG